MKACNVKLIFSSDADKQLLLDTLELQRQAWNIVSGVRFGMNPPGLKVLHDACYFKVRKAVPDLPSTFVIKSEQDVLSCYKTIRKNKHKLEQPAVKHNLSVQLDKCSYRWFAKDDIAITTISGRIRCKLQTYDRLNGFDFSTLCDPKLFVRNGDVFLTLIFDDLAKLELPKITALGVDLGVKRIACTSEGKIIKGSKFKELKRKIRFLKRELQSKEKAKSKSAKRHLKQLKRRERNVTKYHVHVFANQILDTKADVIVLEDLTEIKQSKTSKGFSNRRSQIPFFELKQVLSYKAPYCKKSVETVNPAYTSQTDHRDGLRSGVRKGCRFYAGDGVVLDADINAAVNIALKSRLLPISCAALDGQGRVNDPYAGLRLQAA